MKKEYDFSKMKEAQPRYLKHIKSAITMRINPGVISYFKKLADKVGLPYQSLINYVLCEYANRKLEPSANWGKAGNKK